MTSPLLYNEFVTNHVCDYIEKQRAKYNPYRVYGNFESLDLANRIIHCNNLSARYEQLKLIHLDDCIADVLGEIKESFVPRLNQYQERVALLQAGRDKDLRQVDIDKESRIQDKTNEIHAHKAKLRASMADIITKHEELVKLKPELDNVFKIYGLSTTRVSVAYDSASLKDLSEAIDIASLACKLTIGNSNIFSKAASLLYLPTIKKFEDEMTNNVFKWSWIVSLAILAIFARPYFFGTVGLIYIISMFGNIYKVYEKEELLYLAYSLTDTLDFDRFIEQDETYLQLLQDLDLLSMEDVSLKKIEINDFYDKQLVTLDQENPKHELDKEERAYVQALDSIRKECEDAERQVMKELGSIITSYEMELEMIRKKFDEMHAETVFLGTEVSRSKTLSTKFKLGVGKFEGKPVTEAVLDVPLKDILFTYKNEKEREDHINFIKLLMCNVLCNVREKHVKVTIFDSHNLGREFAEFYDTTLADYIKPQNTDFRKLLEELITRSNKNILKFGTQNIQHFNSQAEAIGKVTEDYNLVIILSTEEELVNNKVFKEYLSYSADVGTWIWYLSKDESLYEEKQRADFSKFYTGLPRSTVPGEIDYGDKAIGRFFDPIEPYRYDQILGAKTVNSLIAAIEENRVDVLDYETGFRQVVIPDEKIWTYSTVDHIEFNFGYQDGDPSKPHVLTLGTVGSVHGLGGGTTGAGKSALIDMMLASLLHKYSPEELEIVMIDFKNIEFKKYTDEYLIPHAKIIAGTKDGEYAISIFDYLIAEMNRRTKLFGEYKLQNLSQYNRYVRDVLKKPELALPRVFVLIDEYQVMFREVDDKSLDTIKQRITSLAALARFAGCHMLFVSQSMDGTMPPAVMEQFSLRLALRVNSEETSKNLIGSPLAGQIKERNGYMYSNTSGGGDQSTTKFWRLPYASETYIKQYMKRLIARGQAGGNLHRQARFYDEDEKHQGVEMLEWIEKLPSMVSDSATLKSMFVLGERTSYSQNRAPENFKILRRDNEHLVCSAFEMQSILNLANTFIENIKSKEDATLIVHSADSDATTLLDLENRVPEKYRSLITEKYTAAELLELLENVVARRKENPTAEYKPVYFMGIYWDKLDGLGRGDTYKMQDKFKTLLQDAGSLNVHILMFVKEMKEFRSVKPYFAHKIISFAEEMESSLLIDSSKATKLAKEGTTAIYQYGATMKKFKIYQFPTHGTLEEREVVVTF